MIHHGDWTVGLLFKQFYTNFFGGAALIDAGWGALNFAVAGNGLASGRIAGDAAIVDGVCVVFGANELGGAIEVNDEVSTGVEFDVTVGEGLIDGCGGVN